jgi:hypothetical protein
MMILLYLASEGVDGDVDVVRALVWQPNLPAIRGGCCIRTVRHCYRLLTPEVCNRLAPTTGIGQVL